MHPTWTKFFQKLLATEEALAPIFVTNDPLAQSIAAIVITTTSIIGSIFNPPTVTPAPVAPAPAAPAA